MTTETEGSPAKTTQGKGGRPPKPEAQKRKKYAVYLSDGEHRRIQEKAKKSDLTFSEFMRYTAEGKRAITVSDVPKEILKLKAELERIGVNINQLAKRAHTDGYGQEKDRIGQVLENSLIPTLQQLNSAYQ